MAALNSTLYTGQTGGTVATPGVGLANQVKTVQAVVVIPVTGTGTNLNDTIGLFILPKNATLKGFSIRTDRLDTDAAPTLTIDAGYTGTTQAFVAAWAGAKNVITAVSPNEVTAVIGAYGYTPTVDTPIFATVRAAGTTKAAGTLVATMIYEMAGVAS